MKMLSIAKVAAGIVALCALAFGALALMMFDIQYDAARSEICKISDSRGWRSADSLSASFRSDGIEYFVDIGRPFAVNRDTWQRAAPLRNVFWFVIRGGTVGSAVGKRSAPMLYDPREAAVEIEGRRVNALPRIWSATDERDAQYVEHWSVREANSTSRVRVVLSPGRLAFAPDPLERAPNFHSPNQMSVKC